MDKDKIISTIKEMCHNGTHSCKIRDLLEATGATKQELYDAIVSSGLHWRVENNINKLKLLVLD